MCMAGKKTILELREIYTCLTLSKNIAAKATITFILSSGMNRNEALALTIGDLLSACHEDIIDSLLKLLRIIKDSYESCLNFVAVSDTHYNDHNRSIFFC